MKTLITSVSWGGGQPQYLSKAGNEVSESSLTNTVIAVEDLQSNNCKIPRVCDSDLHHNDIKSITNILTYSPSDLKTAFTHTEGVNNAFCLRRIKCAFTLAEVLITLGIIGIIAALTMPSLIAKQQEKQTVTALKKFYSTSQQAFSISSIEEDFSANNIMKKYKTLKICYPEDNTCTKQSYKYLNGAEAGFWGNNDASTKSYKAVLSDGSLLRYYSYDPCIAAGTGNALKNVCGEISIDVNGDKKPNIIGKDVFYFYISKYGILPFGTPEETRYKFSTCTINGTGCAAWVLFNENMDYLKCGDLSWGNKTKCK